MLHANIDWARSDAPGQVTLAGWAFNGDTEGQHPFSVRIYYVADTGQAREGTVTVRHSGIRRDDVPAAFGQYPRLNRFTGFELVALVPSGYRKIDLEWADSRGAVYVSTTVTVR